MIIDEIQNKGLMERDFLPPCDYMKVETDYFNMQSTEIINAASQVWIGVPSIITVTKQTQAYSFLSLIAEIGGYVGLFLGLSVYYGVKDLFNKIVVLHIHLTSFQQPKTDA